MRLHHVGFIVNDIDIWEKNLVYENKISDLFDPIQNARLALYTNYSNSLIELIQPVNKSAFTWNSLKKNGENFNHFCYELEDEIELSVVTSRIRMVKVLGPVPAILFEGRNIFFYYGRNHQIVEFIINNHS